MINILLWIAAVTGVLSAIGMLLMRDYYQRLHYLGPPSTLSIFLIAAAIVVQEGASQATTKAILTAVALAIINPVVTHAMARAARIRTYGHWASQAHEGERRAGD